MKGHNVVQIVAAAAFIFLCQDSLARNCRKGIPCGGSCIAANKVCHIGTPTATSTKSTAISITSQASSKSQAVGNANTSMPASTTPAGYGTSVGSAQVSASGRQRWIGSISDHIYFREGCTAERELASSNRRIFRNEDEALLQGFEHSRVPGC